MVLLVADLKALAKANKIPGYGKMKKPELINVLVEKDIIKEEDARKKPKEPKPKKVKEVVVVPEEEKEIYCGIQSLKKNQRYGDMRECFNKNSYSRFGLFKIDDALIQNKGTKKQLEKDLEAKTKLYVAARTKRMAMEKEYEKNIDKIEYNKGNTEKKYVDMVKELEDRNEEIKKTIPKKVEVQKLKDDYEEAKKRLEDLEKNMTAPNIAPVVQVVENVGDQLLNAIDRLNKTKKVINKEINALAKQEKEINKIMTSGMPMPKMMGPPPSQSKKSQKIVEETIFVPPQMTEEEKEALRREAKARVQQEKEEYREIRSKRYDRETFIRTHMRNKYSVRLLKQMMAPSSGYWYLYLEQNYKEKDKFSLEDVIKLMQDPESNLYKLSGKGEKEYLDD
jgi:hypothetical protein